MRYSIGVFADEEMRPDDLRMRAYWRTLQHNPMDFMRPLLDQGVSLFVCNNAFSGFALELAWRISPPGRPLTRGRVVALHDELAAHFLPGIDAGLPAGVAAVNAAQEARFTFLP